MVFLQRRRVNIIKLNREEFFIGDTVDEATLNHHKNLRVLLQRCQEKIIKLKREKFFLYCKQIPFFGQLLTHEGLTPDLAKVKAITEMKKIMMMCLMFNAS
ncbi:hypothetical protein SNE40_003075 [Patella caerulea]|uniref:Uncharacterized protein n=1 Tax=Patella caerulea TaxID=87958 RepID=A0AAN8K8Z8_PATCE